MRIKVIEIGSKRYFPLASVIENGIRCFDDKKVEGKKMYTDITSLEDLIEFQKIIYKIIGGYYFDE